MRLERLQQLYGIEGKIVVITDSGGLSSKDVARSWPMPGPRSLLTATRLQAVPSSTRSRPPVGKPRPSPPTSSRKPE